MSDSTREYFVFSCPEMDDCKRRLLTHPTLGHHFKEGIIDWGCFDDGFPNLFIRDVSKITGKDVLFLASFVETKNIFSQLSALFALPRYFVKSLTIALPYFPTATMERVDEEGQVATAVSLARLLSSTPLTANGPSKLVLFDIHTLQNRFYFSDNVIPVMLSAIPLFIEQLKLNHANEKISIAFPDEGALKRFGKLFKDYTTVVFTKQRNGDQRNLTIKDGLEFIKDRHVFIVDDLVQSGGTLLSCAKYLIGENCAAVSCYVTHAVFPKESYNKFIGNDKIKRFYITDSCPGSAKAVEGREPFVVIHIQDPLAQSVLN